MKTTNKKELSYFRLKLESYLSEHFPEKVEDKPFINERSALKYINKETPEMKQLISGIQEVSRRIREIAQTHRPLFGGEIYLTGREVCERLFISPRTLQDYRDKGIIPYTQIAGKILYKLSDIDRLLQENYHS